MSLQTHFSKLPRTWQAAAFLHGVQLACMYASSSGCSLKKRSHNRGGCICQPPSMHWPQSSCRRGERFSSFWYGLKTFGLQCINRAATSVLERSLDSCPLSSGASGSDSVDVDNQWCHINAYKRPMRVCLGWQAVMGTVAVRCQLLFSRQDRSPICFRQHKST